MYRTRQHLRSSEPQEQILRFCLKPRPIVARDDRHEGPMASLRSPSSYDANALGNAVQTRGQNNDVGQQPLSRIADATS